MLHSPGARSHLSLDKEAPDGRLHWAAGTRQDHLDSRSRWPPPSLPTGGLVQLNRFDTIGPVLPSGCLPPHPQRSGVLQWRPDGPAPLAPLLSTVS